MKTFNLKYVLFLLLIIVSSDIVSQVQSGDEVEQVLITMNNGEEFIGKILSETEKEIVLKMINGEVTLFKENIKSIEIYEYSGDFAFVNPNETRYFFAPSAIPLKKGKGYYQNIYATFNFVNVGVSDNVSVGGGFEFVSTIMGVPVWFLTPKVGFTIKENLHLGGGVFVAGVSNESSAALLYGSVTIGNSETSATINIGYGLVDRVFTNYPTINVSVTHRISNGVALLTENYLLPSTDEVLPYFGIHGIRLLGRKNSFDIGAIVIPAAFDLIPALPYVGYIRTF